MHKTEKENFPQNTILLLDRRINKRSENDQNRGKI